MTIASTPRKAGPLLGNGVQSTWPFAFKVFAATDVKVTIADSAGVETVLTSNYSVALNANQDTSPGGTVTYPVSGTKLPTGSVLAITGDIDYNQPLDLPSGGSFSPLAQENQFDRTTMQIQQLREEMSRTAKLPVTSAEDADQLIADITLLANSADNIDTVAGSIASVDSVAVNIADITLVANNVTDVTNFADVYQGAKASDPTLRNDGSALRPGDLYFNTVENALRVYNGTVWVVGTAGAVSVQNFSGDDVTTDFVLSTAPASENNIQVYIAGVYQQKNQYALSGATLVFSTAPPTGTDNIEVVVLSSLALGVTDAALVAFTPAGGIAATNVQAAIAELDSEAAKKSTAQTFTAKQTFSAGLEVSGSAPLGYTTGAGGTVTQATSKSTTVSLNTLSGRITMNAATLNAGTNVEFQLNNSLLLATDLLLVCVQGSSGTQYQAWPRAINGGNAVIVVRNTGAANASDAVVLTFAIMKGVVG